MPENIKILGHRGTRHNPMAHENTLPAFAHALATADGLETDVVCSADGVPYLLHNATQHFIPYVFSWVSTNGPDIRHMHSSEVDEIVLKDGNDILRLSDLFIFSARMKERKILNLELKAPETARPVLEVIDFAEKKNWIDRTQVIVSSFDHNEIAMVQRLDPSIKTGLIFRQDSVRPCRLYPWSEKYPAQALPISIKNLENEQIRKIMPDYFVLPVQGLTEIYSDAVAQEYSKSSFMVWTAGKEPLPEHNRRLLEKLSDPVIGPRISAVITNHPQEMKRIFG